MPPIVVGLGNNSEKFDWKDPLGIYGGGGLAPKVEERPVVAETKPVAAPEKSHLPAGMRNNNPGNIKYTRPGAFAGVVGPSENTDQGDPQAVFDSPESGMSAMYQLAMRKYDGGKTSTNKLIAGDMGWTPGNLKAAENVARSMGLSADDDLNLHDPAMAAKFMRALVRQEHGRASDAYSDEQINQAISLGLATANAKGIPVEAGFETKDALGIYGNNNPFAAIDKETAARAAAEAPDISSATAFLQTKLRGHGPEHITGMKPDMQTGLSALLQAAPPEIADGLEIFSGTRTVERQKELFDAAVARYGSVAEARKWVAPPPGEHGSKGSQHNHGTAADLGFKGQRLDKAPAHVQQWVHENAGRFGMAFPLGNEPWHIETASARGGGAVASAQLPAAKVSASAVTVAGDFKPKDDMGLYGDSNPFATVATAGAVAQADDEAAARAQAATAEVDASNQQADALATELDAKSPGRYQTIDQAEFEAWQQQWETENRSGGLGGDAARIAKIGLGSTSLALREAVGQIPGVGGAVVSGIDSIYEWVKGEGPEARIGRESAKAEASLSPAMGEAREKKWITETKVPGTENTWKYGLGPAWSDPRSYFSGLVESAPGTAATMAPSALAARGAFKRAVAAGLAEKEAAGAAATTALLSGAVSEGILGGGQSAIAVREKIGQLPRETILSSEAVQSLISEGMSEDAAISAVTEDAATQAFIISGAATGLFGGMGDRTLAKILAEGVGGTVAKRILRGAGRGFVGEGLLEEAPQSAASQAAENYSVQTVDPNQRLGEGVADAAAGGFAVGGVMGGAMGGAGGAVSPATEPVIDEPVSSPVIEENPPAGARRAGPLARALDHGAAQTAQQPPATIGGQVAAAAAESSGVRPELQSTVEVAAEGIDPFMGRIEGYDGDEAIVVDGNGEVFQIPLAQMKVLAGPPDGSPLLKTGDSLPESSSDPALEPQSPVASETVSEMPPRKEQQPATERLTGAPAPGQRVIVDTKELGRFPARIDSYEEGATEALVTNGDGKSYQVPVDRLFVSKLTDKQVEDQELKRNPPVERETPVLTGTDRRIGDKTVSMPDELHARLYDLGKERLTTKRLLGTGQMDMNDALPSQQRQLAKEFGVDPQALGQMADDYRYRAERAAKGARSRLATKLPPVNEKRLKDWQAEHRRAGAVPDPVAAPDDNQVWWDGLSAEARRGVLDGAGVKRSEKLDWAAHSANIRAKLAALRAPDAPLPIEESVHIAATSPHNDLPEPTQAQKEAGNYKVGRLKLAGLDISVENPAGSERKGTDASGKEWSVEMKSHYGYIRGTVGKDKDHIDIFVKPGTESVAEDAPIFVIDQKDGGTGRFDEHKVMAGFASEDEARAAYLENYTKGWNGLGDITATTMADFKRWLQDGDTSKQFAPKWFASRDKADAYILKNSMSGSHEVVERGKRFEIRPNTSPNVAPDVPAAVQEEASGVTAGDVRDLFRSKEFKTAYADIAATQMGTPHPESPVAYELARGWRDQKAGKPPEHQEVPDHSTSDPIEPYYMGYAAARDGKARVIRASKQEEAYRELSGAKPEPAPPPALAARAQDRPRAPKKTALLDRLENYFRPDRIVESYGGRDRVLSFDRLSEQGQWWKVRVREVDAKGKFVGEEREHSTLPSERDMAAWEKENPVSPKAVAGSAKPASPSPKAPIVSENKIFTEDAAEKARALLRKKLSGSQLNSGIDPEIMQAGITLAGYHIEKGARTFAAFASAMLEDLGEVARPYLKSWYMGVKYDPRAYAFTGMSTAADVDAADVSVIGSDQNRSEADEPAELDQSGPGALERAPAEEVRGTESGRQAGKQPAGSGEPDLFGDEPARRERVSAGRSVADGAGELSPASARGQRAGTDSKPVATGPASSEQRPADPVHELSPRQAVAAQRRPVDYTISDDDKLGEGGAKAKFTGNVAAIKLLRVLQQENRPATRDEQSVLAKWVGWGGLRPAFGRDDGTVNKGWEKEAAALKELLTPEEYRAAESSTRNAHYTSAEIVSGVWDAVKRLGFKGGQVLEPSVGAGNFLGLMPGELVPASKVTGVELDHITGGIAKNLYPSANIQAPVGFQDFAVPDGHFDLAIGNPPFGSERLYDKTRRHLNKLSIHNFFFAKAMEAVKPGGVLAMVVTNRFLDGANAAARELIAKDADLVGAIRLPNNAFAKNAGTEVTTDIVLLRKREGGEKPGASWTVVKDYRGADGKTVPLNEYFVKNPDMMLGEFGAYGTMYGPDDPALVAREGQETPALLERAIGKLPQNIMAAPGANVGTEVVVVPDSVNDALVGSMFLSPDGVVHIRSADSLGVARSAPAEFRNETAKERVAGMVRIRDAFARLRRAQIDEGSTDEKLASLRERLNKFYDAFVKKHGPINSDPNRRLFRDDPTWPQISALEEGFDKGISAAQAKATGETARLPSARKSPIFTKRTQQPYKRPTSATSAKDALATTLADLGRVDLAAMSRLYGKTEDAIVDELGSLLFKTPSGAYETADDYLSGNVREKLAEAERAAEDDPAFRRNVAALRDVIPADIEAVDIDVKPGAPWVPAGHIEDFIKHIADTSVTPKAFWSPFNAKWAVEVPHPSPAAEAQWSTNRTTVSSVLESVLNGQTITVRDRLNDGSTVVNQAATDAANEKAERVKAEWRKWLWQDDARREELSRLYNDTFNTDVIRAFDGAHLQLPGKVGDDIISLRPHQKNFVWRTLQSSTTLADHTVGAGKTFALIAAAMEMRRTGQARKPMFTVPNHLVGQWAADFVKLYPGAKVLAATKKDFEAENRKRLFARVATGDWDAVIVSHSSFGKIGVDPEFEKAFIEDQIAEIEASTIELRRQTGEKSRNVAQLTKARDTLKAKLQRLLDAGAKDVGMTFDELGIDALFVDEAHEFKNLGFATSMTRVAGLGNPQGSQKAADLYMKVLSVQQRTGGKNIVFATGTPLSNTMAEMFTVQRYLDGKALKQLGIAHFDAWAKVFGEVVTDWELSPSGQYRLNSRFAKFVNMPELMQRYQSFADVITNDDIKAQLAAIGKTLPLPNVKGGKPQNVVVPRSNDQAVYIGEGKTDDAGQLTFPKGSLVWRAENLPKKAEKGADNMLKVMSDARKAALDMRLIDPSYGDVAGSKVHIAADNMKRIYDAWQNKKGTQLVFIDLSTPKKARAKEEARIRELVAKAEAGDDVAQTALDNMSPDEFDALNGTFSVYDDLKEKLIKRGIPEAEIAFIHDANTDLQKEELFGKVRSGQVRFLFGSTPKMGAGTNVQNRLVALHHLDAPWRPSDLEQRDGRGIRQGNELYGEDPEGFEIEILRYATKNTLDARQWQTIEAKAKFIQQMRKGGVKTREIEDIAGEAANAAEMKAAASGNPLILEEMDERRKLRRLEAQAIEHDREQYRLQRRITEMRDDAARLTAKLPDMEADAARAAEIAGQPLNMEMLGATIDKPKDMGEAIIKEGIRLVRDKETESDLGKYGGFDLALEHFHGNTFVVSITGDTRREVSIADIGTENAVGLGMKIANSVKRMAEAPAQARERIAEIEQQVPALEKQIAPWGNSDELAATAERHRALLDALRPKPKSVTPVQAPDDAEFQAAYHGSPHQFETFSTSAIGTGEGAQAFGWGLYFAEDRELAEMYRETLSRRKGMHHANPDRVEVDTGHGPAIFRQNDKEYDFYKRFLDKPPTADELEQLRRENEGTRRTMMRSSNPAEYSKLYAQSSMRLNAAEKVAEGKVTFIQGDKPGKLFNVELPEDNELLVFDAPLSEQSLEVQEKLRKIAAKKPGFFANSTKKFHYETLKDIQSSMDWTKTTGKDFYYALAGAFASKRARGDREASLALKEAGIPGHKFLDGRSRGKGEGTYNFVIYDDKRIEVISPTSGKTVWATLQPEGWGVAETDTDTGLGSPEDIKAVNDIVRNVAGLNDVLWMKRIVLPNGAGEAWGGDNAPTTAGGFYSPGQDVIAIAEPTASETVAYHEAFHRLQHLFLSPREKAVLKAEIGRLRRMVQTRIGREKQAAKMSAHEIEAEAFAIYAAGASKIKPHALLRAAWDRILTAIRQVQNFLQGRGFQTAEDVFNRAKSGEIAKRAPNSRKPADTQYSVAPDIVTESRVMSELSAKLTDITPAVLKAIPLNYFTELARKNMTAVGDYLRVKRLLDAYRGKKHAEADAIAQEWLKYVRNGFMGKDKTRAATLSSLMHDATLAGIDPDQPNEIDESKPQYKDLMQRWAKIPAAGREVYRKARDAYKEQAEELDRILLDNVRKAQQIAVDRAEDRHKKEVARIEASGLDGAAKKRALDDANRAYTTERTKAQWSMKARITKMRMAFEASRVEPPYFPLARFGRYFVSVRGVDGEVLHFSKHESASERDKTARAMQKAYPGAKQQIGVMDNGNELRAAMDPRVLAEIDEILGGASVDSSVMDQIWQRYLESMPDLSNRKRFIHRKGVAGFDQDAMRVFASHMFHAAHQMGRLKYGLELQELVNKAKDQANEADDQTRAMTLANELRNRHKWVMNPTGSKVAQVMTSAAFVWYLAASPASAAVNLTQTVMMGVPILGGRFGGVAKASAALLRASKDFIVGKGAAANANLKDDEKRAMAAFYESGLIDRTQSHDIAGVGETGVEYSPVRAKIMGVISWAFHKAEVANREITALAAYRLARASGGSELTAIDTAHDMTWKTHFDYSNSSRPALMQNDLAKVALVFRSYNINMLYRVFRDIQQSVAGESAQVRREARYQLAGVVGMMSLMAGVTGTIGFNLAMALAGMIFGDDDDPMEFTEQFKKNVVDVLGPELGGVVLNGVPGHYLGIDLTSRIGMPDLWFRSPSRELQGKDEFQYWFSQVAGASIGMLESAYSGFSIMTDEGDIARGLEVMAPKAIRDLMKAYRYTSEGVTSVRGDEILDPGSIDYHDIIAQALGFTPAKVAETWDRNSALKNAESAVNKRRRSLVNDWAQAAQADDKPRRAAAIDAIKAFNAVPLHQSVPITRDTLQQSLKVRARNRAKREDGVLIQNPILGKKLREKLAGKIYGE